MNAILEALRSTGVFYVATVDDAGCPRVRPFGAAAEYEGKVYLCTNNTKPCFRQMLTHPDVEICGMENESTWIRLSGKLRRDDRPEAREAMLEQNEGLRRMYAANDGLFEVLYLEDPVCTRYSFTAPPEAVE